MEFAERQAKIGLEAALDVYGEKSDPEYKTLTDRYGWLLNMSNDGENPLGDAFSAFGL